MLIGVRELVGWLLVLLGLGLIGVDFMLALNRSVIEALALALPSAIVFRSGIGLVRISMAARIALRLDEKRT
ncbi:MAG: hypothetical protein P8L78_08215 [Mariniblastus sp.]|jgi:hypothetical protein|nr:hypothetical protein [Mariniblastus sp.]MDG1514125.1 hypothetical protein [Mariniblastus sp.]MDG2181662.1 hypothetical protein [Mariniblastus sp.]